MIKQTLLKRELFVRGPKVFGSAIFCVVLLLIAVLTLLQPASKVAAATNNNLNFQARLQTAGGALAPDGYYNIEFNLYNASSGGSSLWSETYYDSNGVTAGNDNRVRVKNGYLTVNLGSQTAFPGTINWDQDLWITMNVGGTTQTATPTWDGEMSPRLKLTGVPYAFRAGQLAKYNSVSGFSGVLQFQNTTGGNQVFEIPDQGAAGTYTLMTTASASGSFVQFAPSSAQVDALTNSSIFINKTGASGNLIQMQRNGVDTFTVSNSGALVAVGVSAGSGLLQGTGGLTVTGTVSVNNNNNSNTSINTGTSTGLVSIGGGSGTFALNTTNIDISSGGAITGATGLTLASGNFDQSASAGTFATGTGAVSLNGDTTIAAGKNLIINGNTQFKQGTDFSTNGSSDNVNFGTTSFVRLTGSATQTITGIAGGADGRTLTILNAGSVAAVISNNSGSSSAANRITTGTGGDISLPVGGSITVIYDSTASLWRLVGGTSASGGAGVNTIGTFNSGTSYANGASISGTTLTLGAADGTNPGLVSTAAQTFAGTKTFSGNIIGQSGLSVSGALVELNHNSNFAVNLGTGTNNALVSIGGGSGTFALDTTNIDISAAGAVSGVTGYTQASGNFDASGSTGTFATSTGAVSLNGDTTVASGKTFTANGTALFQNNANSTTAFQVQNAAGSKLINVDTTPDAANVVTNPSFEVDTSGWTARAGTANFQRITTQAYSGGAALSFDNDASGDGANYAVQLSPSTTYFITFFIRSGSGTNSTMRFGYAHNGSDETTYLSGAGQTFTNGGWTKYFYGFTTPGSVAGNAYFFITSTSSTARTFYIDNVSIAASGNTSLGPLGLEGKIQLGGVITSPTILRNSVDSTSAFTIQNTGTSLLFNADTLNSTITIGNNSTTNTAKLFVVTTSLPGIVVNQSSTSDLLRLVDNSGTATSVFTVADEGLTTIRTLTNDANGFRVQNASSNEVFTVDTSAAQIVLGKASSVTGKQVFQNGTNANTVTLQSGVTSASYTLTLPTAGAAGSNYCLVDTNGSGVLGFVSCATGNNGSYIQLAPNSAQVDSSTNSSIFINKTGASGNLVQMQNNGSDVFTVSNTGALVAVGVNAGSGLLQGTGGLTLTGTTSVNNNNNSATSINTGTSTGLVSIGGGAGTFALDTTNIDISAAGAISGVTGFTQASGNFNASASTGTFATSTGNVSLNGDTSVASGKTFTANGTALFKNNVDSATAFQIQNAVGTSIVNVDTVTDPANLITNPSFEVNTTGWAARGATANFQRITTQYYTGGAALSFDSSAIGHGANYPIQLSPSTAYSFYAYIKVASGGSANNLRFGYAADGADETTLLSGTIPYNTNGWYRGRFDFTTPGSVAANAYLFINSTSATARTFYVDTALVVPTGVGYPLYSEGKIQLNGVVTSPVFLRGTFDSTNAFEVQASSGARHFAVDTANGHVTIGNIIQSANTPSKLYINATSSTGLTIAQSTAASDGANISLNNSSGTQVNGLLINRNTAGGTTTNLLNLTQTNGTATNAISISSGTFATGLNLNGATFTNLIDSANFDVSNAGAVTAVGVNAGSGLLQGTGGLTLTGATSVNTTGTANTQIGNATGTFQLDSNTLDISSGGAVSGVTGLTLVGTANLATQRNVTDFTTTGSSNDVNLGTGSLFRLNGASAQTITGLAGGADGRRITIVNAAAQAATISNNSGSSVAANRITTGTGADLTLPAGGSIELIYDSSASLWRLVGGSSAAGGAGVNTIGTFNSGTSYANGASISGTTLTLGAADGTNPGLVSTAAQTFAGAKTFNGQIIGAAGISVTGGAVSLTGNTASSLTTSSGALTLTSAAAATWSTAAGNLTLQAGSGTVSLGTSTALTADGALSITSGGSGALTLDTAGAAALNLGNANATTVNLGTNNNSPTINIGTGTGNDTVNIATGSGTNAVSIGNSSGTNTIGIVGATTLTAGSVGQIVLTAQGTSGQTASLVQVKTQSSGGTLALNIQADGSTAFLGAQPAAVGAGNGTLAGAFGYSFTATGAKGGNTSAAGQSGGNGGSVSLTGGAGGDPTGGGTNGSGGSIILQGGAPGSGGSGGFYGGVTIQANGGFTGIGTNAGLNTLLVKGVTTTDLLATSIFGTGVTSQKGIVVQGVASQTANLFELQDSAGSILMSANAGAHLETLGGYNNPWGGVGSYGNLLVQSEAFDNASWTRTNVTAPTANTITDPLGGTTAESLVATVAVGSIGQTSSTAPTNNNYTFSVWLKTAAGTQSAALRIDGATTGTGTAKFITVTSTWQRFFVTQNTNGFTGNIRAIIFPGGIGTGTVHAWGASMQLNSNPGVYVQTGASTVAAANGITGRNIYTPGTVTAVGAITGATINGLTLASAADGFTVAGGTTPRTLTVTGANITIGSTIQPTSAGTLAIQSNGANNMTVDTGGAATLNLGNTNATTIAIGNGSSALNFNVPTAQFTESASARTLTVQTRSAANVGTGLTVRAGTGNGANAGGVTTLQGGTGGATGGGGNTQVYGGDAGGGNTNGGNVIISGGNEAGSGTAGSVIIKPQSGNDSTTAFQVQNASGTAMMNVNTTSNAISLLSTLTPDITSWTDLTGTPLTAARSSHALTYGNGYVYAIGGSGSTTAYYSKVNSDGTLAGWATTTTISGATTGVEEANAVFLNGYVYYIGGSNAGTAVTTVIYAKQNADGTLGSWMSATGLPSGRISPVIMTAYGNIYVMGGNNGTPSTSVYHAKPGADGAISSWTTSGNTLPLARHYPGGTSVNGVLYVVAGADTGFSATNTVFHATINPVTGAVGSWTNSGSTLPANRLANVVYAANGYLYSTAGENSGVHNQTYYSRINSNGTLNAWGTLGSTANLPVNNAFGKGFVANGYVYLVGGYNGTADVATVYSSSFPRVQVGGNLDLLGLQGANMNDGSDASSGSMGGSITAGNIRAAGVLEVAGAALINGGAVIAGNSVLDVVSANSLQLNESGSARTLGVQTRTSNAAGTGLTISAGAAGSGASAFAGGALALTGGAAGGTGNANGGAVTISGGAGTGTGTKGVVSLSTTAFDAAAVQTLSSSGVTAVTAGNVDAYSTLPITASVTGAILSVPDPSQTSYIGRVMYVAARNGSNDFTLRLNAADTPIDINMKANNTATLIWNGTDWTAAGASSSTDLQSAYNNTLTSAGGAELVLNAPGANADGLTIRNNGTTPINGGIFEVQSSIGTNLFSVNNLGTELAVNGGAETAGGTSITFPASTWTSAPAGGTIARTVTSGQYVTGQAGVAVTTTTTAATGVTNNLTANPVVSTTYQVSFAAKLASGTFTDLEVLYSRNGGTNTQPCTSYSTQTLSTSVWTKITCTITTDATTATNPDLIIRQGAGGTARTFYIDNLSFMRNDSTTQPSNVQIGGGISGGPVTLFTLDRSTAPPVPSGDSTYFGSMYYDITTGRIQCYESDGWGACGSAPDNIIVLTPEYTNAVLGGPGEVNGVATATGIGTLTADFCANENNILEVNVSFCAAGLSRNYYRWTSPQASAQTYSIYVSYKLPSTFKEFYDNDTIKLTALKDHATNAGATLEVFKSTGGAVSQCGSTTTITTSTSSWVTTPLTGNEQSCTFVAGNTILFKINVTAQSNANVYIENLEFRFTNL